MDGWMGLTIFFFFFLRLQLKLGYDSRLSNSFLEDLREL